MSCFKDGYKAFIRNTDSYYAARMGGKYVDDVAHAISNLENLVNGKSFGKLTPNDKLKGNIAEYWHSGTFNINATLNNSPNRAKTVGSNDFASVDITITDGLKFSLKYYADGRKSANEQSISYFERYSRYKSQSGRTDLSFLDFLRERGIDDESVMYDPIYSGQVRIIPADQLKEAIEYLKWKIAKEGLNRPEQVARLQDTLNNLSAVLESSDGVKSIELTESQAKDIAAIAKEGRFKASDYGLTTEELVDFRYIINEGLEAGKSAALISFVLKTAPEIYRCIEKLAKNGEIDKNDLKKVGFAALDGAATGFVRGFVAASLTTACKSGAFGAALKTVKPSAIAGLTVVLMETLSDSYKVVTGDMPANQMADNLIRNIIVTAAGVGLGIAFEAYLSFIPGAYLLGNFIGTAIGSFVYQTTEDAIMSYCVVSGSTFFGLVEQNYKLPDEVLQHLGFDLAELEKGYMEKGCLEKGRMENGGMEIGKLDTVYILRRGVIGFHRIGYI